MLKSVPHNTMDYSIVICTYNPNERLLQRCLAAVYNLDKNGITTEVILVDNNSHIPVNKLAPVIDFVKKVHGVKIVFVEEQGVQFARIAAIKLATGIYTVYFDYDNEPAADYLQVLKAINTRYPNVAAWGPGNVSVDFTDGIDKNIAAYARIAFQEKQAKETSYACLQEWQECYPFGTGLCTNTFILKEYVALAAEGLFTLTGRKAFAATGGEDTQMVLLCIKKGYAAGLCPALKLTHMIPGDRANTAYLKRLAFGTGICYATCLLQVFPSQRENIYRQIIPPKTFVRRVVKKMIAAKINPAPHKMFLLADYIGFVAGRYTALQKPLPQTINRIIEHLHLQ